MCTCWTQLYNSVKENAESLWEVGCFSCLVVALCRRYFKVALISGPSNQRSTCYGCSWDFRTLGFNSAVCLSLTLAESISPSEIQLKSHPVSAEKCSASWCKAVLTVQIHWYSLILTQNTGVASFLATLSCALTRWIKFCGNVWFAWGLHSKLVWWSSETLRQL